MRLNEEYELMISAPKPARRVIAAFWHWYINANAGESYTYYVGNLAEDREKSIGDRVTVVIEPTSTLAKITHKLFEKGNLHLFQRRIIGGFAYIAVKR